MRVQLFSAMLLIFFITACGSSSKPDFVQGTASSSSSSTDTFFYESLDDGSEKIHFDGTAVTWQGKQWVLDEHTVFIDYRLDEQQLTNPHVFKSFQAAKQASAFISGTIDKRMTVLVAPGVYWIDDPDDGFIRPERTADNPEEDLFGMTITSDWLHLLGLNSNKFNVVLAAARGQQQGSDGNFNLLRINSVGLMTENITFGNYTNVDLVFPLDAKLPEVERLSREKRFDAISQAQLFGGSNVSHAIAVNTAFISRLNLAPFNALYINCYVEATGHAGGGGVYIDSELHLYGTNFSGGTQYYNADIYIEPLSVNTSGQASYEMGFGDNANTSGRAIDTRFHRGNALRNHPVNADMPLGISWSTRTPKNPVTRSYQYNVTLEGKPYVIQDHFTPGSSVVIADDSELLKAYRVTHNGEVYYNLQNILGLENFDGNNAVYLPYANTLAITAAELADGTADGYYRSIPRTANLVRDDDKPLRTGNEAIIFSVSPEADKIAEPGEWTFSAYDYQPDHNVAIDPATKRYKPATYVKLDADGSRVKVTSILSGFEEKTILLVAKNTLGLEAAILATVQPEYMDPPVFKPGQSPKIVLGAGGKATLDYAFPMAEAGLLDTSVITWFRVDQSGNKFPLVVSRLDKPEQEYIPGKGDIGYYLMAEITPKYNVSEFSPTTTSVVSANPVTANDVTTDTDDTGKKIIRIETDFNNMPANPQHEVMPGSWTRTNGMGESGWTWADGSTTQGAAGFTGLQTASDRQSRLHYQPVGSGFGDVTLTVKLAPNKTAGQGFGSAPDFLDIYIKSDGVRNDAIVRGEPGTMNGYALRFQRLAAPSIETLGFNGAGAVAGLAVYLVEIKDGKASAVSYDSSNRPFGSTLPQTILDPENPQKQYTDGVMVSAYLSELTATISLVDGKLKARVTSTRDARSGDAFGYLRQAYLEADVTMTSLGGTGLYYSSSSGSDNSTVLTYWNAAISVTKD